MADRDSVKKGDMIGENIGAVGVEEPLLAVTSSRLGDRVGVAKIYEAESGMHREALVRSSSMSEADCVREID